MKDLSKIWLLLFLLGAFACQENPTSTKPSKKQTPKKVIDVPQFDAQIAYDYIGKQVAFGPRVPGVEAHKECADWLESELGKFADKIEVQKSKLKVPGDIMVPMFNVIGSFNPQAKKRVLLCAHWDTRPWADQDSERQEEPIDGANDGGSGVGVLLEIARQLKEKPVSFGVDIVFFDVEDYGKPGIADSYAMGSQYWGKQAKSTGYKAQYGILLDMVGAENAIFHQEGLSKNIAQHVLDKVWAAGNDAGYSSYFSFKQVPPVTDDHQYVNYYTGIPIIDIIQYDGRFGDFWHTHDDSMEIIDKRTLKAVGQTLLHVIYHEDSGQ